MAQRRDSQLTVGFDPLFRRQAAWDTINPLTNLTAAFPATSRNWVEVEETNEDILDCTGEDLLLELLTGQVARLTLEMDVDPDILAGMSAFAFGVAVSPTGGTDEVQTLTITATGGTYTLTVMTGANAQTTAPLAYNANAAAIQAALEALSNVDTNDLVVSGTGPYVITAGAAFGKQDINLLVLNLFNLTGGTATIIETTPGVGKTHAISRTTGYALPLMTLTLGFRDSDKQPVIFKNVVVNSLRVRSSSRARVTATIELIGSADLQPATGFVQPPCMNIIPIRFADCQMSINGVDYIAANLGREFEFNFDNAVVGQYDGASVNVTRLERANVRPTGFSFFILGEQYDSNYNMAKAKPTLDAFLRLGPSGRNLKYEAEQAIIKLAPAAIRFSGDPPESEIAILARPKKVPGISTTPIKAIAVSRQSTAFLISA